MNTLRTVTDDIYNMIDPETLRNYDEAEEIRFSPPAYIQRYNTTSDILTKYEGRLKKIVDFGCANLEFLIYLRHIRDVEEIICVDIDRSVLEDNKNKAKPLTGDYIHFRKRPLQINVCEGSVTSADKKLEKADAVTCIELIEHLYPDALTDLPFNIFGYIKPKVAIVTTPNADFNVVFPRFSGFRHPDHKFEWTRKQFQDWGNNITTRYPDYSVTFHDICYGPKGTEHLGACTQMAVFHLNCEENGSELSGTENLYSLVASYNFPFKIDKRTESEKILDEVCHHVNESQTFDNMQGEMSLESLVPLLKNFNVTTESLRTILEEAKGWTVVDREDGPATFIPEYTVRGISFDDVVYPDDCKLTIDYYDGYSDTVDTYSSWDDNIEDDNIEDDNIEDDNIEDDNIEDDETSIIIPESNSNEQCNDSYLFDAEHESSNVDNLSDRSDRSDINDRSIDESTISSLSFSQNDNESSPVVNFDTLSNCDTDGSSNSNDENDMSTESTDKLYKTLDFYHSTSVLSSSI